MTSPAYTGVLPAGLGVPGSFGVVSDQDLADDVQKKAQERVQKKLPGAAAAATVRPVRQLEELNGSRFPVRPCDLLHGLGKTTSALPGLRLAGAGGMPGLMALRTSSQWAILRYLWAFADRRPRLGLSDLAAHVRFRQRALLSEQFGIAIATDLVERVLLPGPGEVVDADAVQYDPYLGGPLASLGDHKPDYFWYVHQDGKVTDVLVVEVKGNSGRRRDTVDQLASGVAQVLVPARVAGARTRRLVIGTCLGGDKITASAVEVDEPARDVRQDAVEYLVTEARGPSTARTRDAGKVDTAEALDLAAPPRHAPEVEPPPLPPLPEPWEARIRVADLPDEAASDAVLAEVGNFDSARLFAFAGLPVSLQRLREAPGELTEAALALETVEADDVAYRCSSVPVPLGTQQLTLRTGVAVDLLRAARSAGAPATTGRAAFRARLAAAHPGEQRYWTPRTSRQRPGETVVAVASPDGYMLTLSGPPDMAEAARWHRNDPASPPSA